MNFTIAPRLRIKKAAENREALALLVETVAVSEMYPNESRPGSRSAAAQMR